MAGMLDGDKFIYDPIALCFSRLDHKLPGKTKTLRERFDEDLVVEMKAWMKEFQPLALKAMRVSELQRERETHVAVQTETKKLAMEMCFEIRRANVRHSELEGWLKPHFGSDPDENAVALGDMRQRLNLHAKDIKEIEAEIRLDERHTDAAVTKQLAAHAAAQTALDHLDKIGDVQQERLVQLRRVGRQLQTRINQQLVAAIPANRPAQVEFGYTEREQARPSAEAKEGKGKDAKKAADSKKGDSGKGTAPPGDVAAGKAAATPPGGEAKGEAAPGVVPAEVPPKETSPK